MKTNSAVPGSTREECPLLRLKASRPVVAWAVVLFLIVSAFSLSRAAVAAAGIDAAMAQLQAPDWEVRKQGVETLAPSAGESREVMNAVLGALRDGDSRVRRAAADATKQIGPKARSAIPALIELLADKDEQVRQSAAEALGQFGSNRICTTGIRRCGPPPSMPWAGLA